MNVLVIRLALSVALIMSTRFVPAPVPGFGERAVLAEPAAISFVHAVGLVPGAPDASSRGSSGIRAAIPAERNQDIGGEGIEERNQDQWDPGSGGFHLGPIIMMLAIAAVFGLLSLGFVILIVVLSARAMRGRKLLQERIRAEHMAPEGVQPVPYGPESAPGVESSATQKPAERFRTCQSCGAEVASDEQFCTQCGVRIEPQRRAHQ